MLPPALGYNHLSSRVLCIAPPGPRAGQTERHHAGDRQQLSNKKDEWLEDMLPPLHQPQVIWKNSPKHSCGQGNGVSVYPCPEFEVVPRS